MESEQPDRNYDERVDYTVQYDDSERKVREELDFNFDGRMDDFYFFENGQLVRQEVDSNFDGRVDVWVSLEGHKSPGCHALGLLSPCGSPSMKARISSRTRR